MSKKILKWFNEEKIKGYGRYEETKKLHGSLDKFTFRSIVYLLSHNRNVCESWNQMCLITLNLKTLILWYYV